MYWEHHPLSFVSGPSYTRKQSYISACRSPAGFIRGARGRAGGYAEVVSPSLSLSSLFLSPLVKTGREEGGGIENRSGRQHRGETERDRRRNRGARVEMRALGLIEVEGREQRYSRRLAISGNTGEYLYACIGCIRSVYTYPPPFFSRPDASPTSRISPVKTGWCLPRSGQETHAPSSIRYEDYVRIPLSSLGSIHVLDSTYHRDSILKS